MPSHKDTMFLLLNQTEREIIATVNNYSRTADGVIRYLRNKVLANYSAHIEMTNEIDAISSPTELMLIVFDDRYHPKARFEAKRKLVLMNLASSIDQRERETGIKNKFSGFLTFLNEYVWSSKAKIGELEIVYLLASIKKSRENLNYLFIFVTSGLAILFDLIL